MLSCPTWRPASPSSRWAFLPCLLPASPCTWPFFVAPGHSCPASGHLRSASGQLLRAPGRIRSAPGRFGPAPGPFVLPATASALPPAHFFGAPPFLSCARALARCLPFARSVYPMPQLVPPTKIAGHPARGWLTRSAAAKRGHHVGTPTDHRTQGATTRARPLHQRDRRGPRQAEASSARAPRLPRARHRHPPPSQTRGAHSASPGTRSSKPSTSQSKLGAWAAGDTSEAA